MKKVVITSCIIFIIGFLIFIWIYQRPNYIDKTYSSTIYSNESDFEKETKVFIKGKLYKNLLSRDEFIGELTADELTFEINLKVFDGRYMGLITQENNTGFIHTIGSINASISLDQVWIQLKEINERYNILEGYISGPSSNKIEAIEIARKIIEGN